MNKTYAVADIHGQYNLWQGIKDFLDENDRCYVLGDCIDRGPDGYKILKEVLEDKRFSFLMGNHEEMMLTYFKRLRPFDKRLWFLNGGETTYNACYIDIDLHDILQALELAPKETKYKNIILTHAGYSPGVESNMSDFLWDREHFYTAWYGEDDEVMVHGHTYGAYIAEELKNLELFTGKKYPITSYSDVIFKYSDGHKICIDGLSYENHQIGILDLDTLELAGVIKDELYN